jgi:hypothetical protein
VAAEHANAIAALPRGGLTVINTDDPHAEVGFPLPRRGRRAVTFALDHG